MGESKGMLGTFPVFSEGENRFSLGPPLRIGTFGKREFALSNDGAHEILPMPHFRQIFNMREGMEKYTPPPEEIAKAEKMMTPEQKVASETRERFKFQERPQFLDELITEQDKGDVRRMPTPEERESMDSNISKLGKIFEGSDVRWQLDGALNISLMKGEYIGVHKDVDLSIEANDLEKLDDQLGRNGYGLFLSTEHPTNETKRQMERVSARQFREAPEAHLMIAAIDEQGKIKENEKLNYIDVHLVKRDADKNPLGYGEVKLPAKWYEPNTKSYQGAEINLSHPAKVAYFKIHWTRPFDATDLRMLTEIGNLTIEDVDEISQVFEQEFMQRRQVAETLLDRVTTNINLETSADGIYGAFVNEPMIAERLQRDESAKEILKELAKKISETDRSPEQVKRLSFQIFNVEKSFDDQRKKVADLRRWIEDGIKLKELRDSLGLEK